MTLLGVKPLHIGIDTGKRGAIAILDHTGNVVLIADNPYISDQSLSWVSGSALQSLILPALEGRRAVAMVERVSSRPGQGVASCFTFGLGVGSMLAVLQTLQIGITFCTPAKWKASYGLGKDKRASLDKGRLMWPGAELHLAKHEGRSEALLIAEYGRRLAIGTVAA